MKNFMKKNITFISVGLTIIAEVVVFLILLSLHLLNMNNPMEFIIMFLILHLVGVVTLNESMRLMEKIK